MERKSNSGKEDKKADASKSGKATNKNKGKGKKPMDTTETMSGVDQITQKAGNLVIDETKVPKRNTKTDIAAKSKGKAVASSAGSKRSRGKQIESVVKSGYHLRSSDEKGMDLDITPTKGIAGSKRKAEEKIEDLLDRIDMEEVCKRITRSGSKDDTFDKDGSGPGTAGRITRSSTKIRRVRSL